MSKYFKAFNKGLMCRDKKYSEGKVFEESGGDICGAGMMHFCETPFDTLDYYQIVDNSMRMPEWAEIEPLSDVVQKGNKRASKKIRIDTKMSFFDFVEAGIKALSEKTKNAKRIRGSKQKDNRDFSDRGEDMEFIYSSGRSAHICIMGEGTRACSLGSQAQIGSSGRRQDVYSSGSSAIIGSAGDHAYINSSGSNAQICSSGHYARIHSSGYNTRIVAAGGNANIHSSGDEVSIVTLGDDAVINCSGGTAWVRMEGERSIAFLTGKTSCFVSGKKGDWIVLTRWSSSRCGVPYLACVKAAQIDGKILKEDTMYRLNENNKFEEVHLK